ncbi:MAG: ATP-grasp domain-containing protein [bacterium]
MNIGITYNIKEEITSTASLDPESFEEFDSIATIEAIYNVLNKNGFDTVKLGGDIEIVDKLKKEKVDFVFNIAEGYEGRNRESHVPSILEMKKIPYSGSDPLTLGLALDKILTKKIASLAGIPIPSYKVINKNDDLTELFSQELLPYPLIVKPSWEGSSKGIYNSSKVYNQEELKEGLTRLFKKYPNQPILVEKYIKGREITVGIIGNSSPKVLGMMEMVNKKEQTDDFFYSLEVKRDWVNLVEYISPPKLTPEIEQVISQYAILAFKEFGCRDLARIDFRISTSNNVNKVFLLEINPLPGLSPVSGDFVIMSKKLGISYDDLVLTILSNALERYNLQI